ncbi:hypothetical protein ACVWW1_001465 [Bradyrhizobium sp. JR3.5]
MSPAAPVMMTPVMPAPVAVAPAPMPVMPAPVMPTAMTVMPAHLLGLQATDLVAGGDGRIRIVAGRRAGIPLERKRRERRRPGGCCKSRHTGGDTEGHLQKIPAFHQSFPLLLSWTNCVSQFFRRDLNAR